MHEPARAHVYAQHVYRQGFICAGRHPLHTYTQLNQWANNAFTYTQLRQQTYNAFTYTRRKA